MKSSWRRKYLLTFLCGQDLTSAFLTLSQPNVWCRKVGSKWSRVCPPTYLVQELCRIDIVRKECVCDTCIPKAPVGLCSCPFLVPWWLAGPVSDCGGHFLLFPVGLGEVKAWPCRVNSPVGAHTHSWGVGFILRQSADCKPQGKSTAH